MMRRVHLSVNSAKPKSNLQLGVYDIEKKSYLNIYLDFYDNDN